MDTTHHGDIEIAYETLGPPDGEPLLLVMGISLQMIMWPAGFCAGLADRGFAVARFVSYPGMGHNMPAELWPSFVDEIHALTNH
jgi:pimeloyl-ACP methyl ester carboxylesterase